MNCKAQSLKRRHFIKIVLPLIVAENERIQADREKLKILSEKKFTTDLRKTMATTKIIRVQS